MFNNCIALEYLKYLKLQLLKLYFVNHFQDNYGLFLSWFLTSSWLHALKHQSIWVEACGGCETKLHYVINKGELSSKPLGSNS